MNREREVLPAQLEHAGAQTEPEYTMETIYIRAHTVTPVLEEVLHNCPPPHWEINDQSTATAKIDKVPVFP